MTIQFNFDKLANIYKETLLSYEKTTAFDIQIGKGKFLFMLFLSVEDKDAKDNLFIYMRNTNVLEKLKMYGNHIGGTFTVYIDDSLRTKLIDELQLRKGDGSFSFDNFLRELNLKIPLHTSRQDIFQVLRNNKEIVNRANIVDDCDKIVLIGVRRLTHGKPRDRTLRKLFIYADGDYEAVKSLIEALKKANCTIAWTTEDKKSQAKSINELINKLY